MIDTIRLGIIKESKTPPDRRTPFTPVQAKEIEQRYPHIKIIIQESPIRAFSDKEYRNEGLEVVSDVSDCDILMGIKEVVISNLIPRKTYLFFSHTIKKQEYNRGLLREILNQKINLIDYEALRDRFGNRLVAFGRYAGILGAYNGLLAYGKKYQLYTTRRAGDCFDLNDLKIELRKIHLPPIKIVLTGSGRVARGAMETLDGAGIRKVNPKNFLTDSYTDPVYTQLHSEDYHVHKQGKEFDRNEFHRSPQHYQSAFNPYTKVADVLLAGSYWSPRGPVLFTRADMQTPDFNIKVISDITCDIEGSIPSTVQPSTILDPFYDYDPSTGHIKKSFQSLDYVTVMAVDNLPCELPRNASEEFGRDLIDKILPPLVIADKEGIIKRATITREGKLTEVFRDLEDYVNIKK